MCLACQKSTKSLLYTGVFIRWNGIVEWIMNNHAHQALSVIHYICSRARYSKVLESWQASCVGSIKKKPSSKWSCKKTRELWARNLPKLVFQTVYAPITVNPHLPQCGQRVGICMGLWGECQPQGWGIYPRLKINASILKILLLGYK